MDLWPYSARQSGRVADAEHESLWSWLADGVLPGQSPNALAVAVNTATRGWTVQPGNLMIRGHVLQVDVGQSGVLDPNASSIRRDMIVGFIDHGPTPWSYGIGVHKGTPGAGTPTITQASAGLWEVPLGEAQILNTGSASLLQDRRRILTVTGGGAQTYGPGIPTAGSWALATVNQLTVTAANYDRLLHVSGTLYTNSTDGATTSQAQLLQDSANMAGGFSIGGPGLYTHTMTTPPVLLAAGTYTLLTMRILVYTGGGRITTVADNRLNSLNVLAVPV